MDFENGYRELQTDGITNLFVGELVKNKTFDVMERQRLQDVLKEQHLETQLSTDGAAKLSQIIGLDFLVYGTVASIKAETKNVLLPGKAAYAEKKVTVTLTMKFVDAVTGQIILMDDASGSKAAQVGQIKGTSAGVTGSDSALANEAMKSAVAKLVGKINEAYPVVGVVIQVNGATIYIDLGRENGVRPGQIYQIYKEGKLLRHPVSGKIMGVVENKTGEMKITRVVNGEMSIGQKQSGTVPIEVGSKVRKIK